jgi:outer membrane protein
VKEQFYNVLASREAISAAQAQILEAEQQLRASTTRLQAGAAIRSDSLRSSVLLGDAQLSLIDAETRLASAKASLRRIIGSEQPVTASGEPADEPIAALRFEVLESLLDGVPEMQQARAQLRSAKSAARSARTSYLPTISASYGRNGSGFDSMYGFDRQFAYASSFRLNLSLPVFNQLQREQTAVRAYVQEDQAEANLRDTRLRVAEQLTLAWGLLQSGQKRIEVQLASVAAAEADLDIQQQRYALNAASQLDVAQSQTQLTASRSRLISARFDFRVARARLEALLGRDLGSL